MSLDAVRPVVASDLPALERIIAATGLFPPSMLAPMLGPSLDGGSAEIWLCDGAEAPRSLVYAAPERMTAGTWNLLLMATDPPAQGSGLGTRLLRHLEAMLTRRGERLLLVETSGLEEFARTRRFYAARGFEEEARIREYYAAGEDKVVFRKALPGGT